MEQFNKILFLLIGFFLFGLVVSVVDGLATHVEGFGRRTFDLTLVYLLRIPLYTMIMLGTVLLRLDLIIRSFYIKPNLHWPTLVIFGWPFVFFVVILPISIYIFPQSDALLQVYYYYHELFGRHASVLASVLFGLGVIWALRGYSSISNWTRPRLCSLWRGVFVA